MKNFKKYIYPASALLIVVALIGVTILSNNHPQLENSNIAQVEQSSEISYLGQEGVDAYTLLQKNAEIEENSSGLIISINGTEANEEDQEFWAFYINGEQAQVGPKDYITKDTDTITWKIEKY